MLGAQPIEHVHFALLLIARLADILTTKVATPKLDLEGNALVRRYGWKYAWLTLLLAFVAYYNTGAAWGLSVASFLVAAQNIRMGWIVRAWGEKQYFEAVVLPTARQANASHAYFSLGLSALLTSLVAAHLILTSPNTTWAWWTGVGIAGYALAVYVHGCSAWRRFFAMARASDAARTHQTAP